MRLGHKARLRLPGKARLSRLVKVRSGSGCCGSRTLSCCLERDWRDELAAAEVVFLLGIRGLIAQHA
jgi:hypothetical protein